MVRPARIVSSADVPQKDSLAIVRRVVHGCHEGFATIPDLSRWASLSDRHSAYAVRAAGVLGWLTTGRDGYEATDLGRALLKTSEGSRAERSRFRQSIEQSPVLKALAPKLLANKSPTREAVACRIAEKTGLAEDTAFRRAGTLLSWRRQAVEPAQLGLDLEPPATDVSSATTLRPDQIRSLERLNPWWRDERGKVLPEHERDFVQQVRKALDQNLAPITVVRGPRQVGKTTAQLQIIEQLLTEGVGGDRILRVQFDELPSLMGLHEPILTVVDWYEANILKRSINAAVRETGPIYVFLDEAQNLRNWHVELKVLVDSNSMTVFATGSSAFRIELGRDSLAGRIKTLEVGTLTLREVARISLGEPIAAAGANPTDYASPEAWRHLVAHGQKHSRARDCAFKAFTELGGYPFAHRTSNAEWSTVAAQLNENVIKRVLMHDLRIGDRGRRRDLSLLESVFRLACRYAGQAPECRNLANEVSQVLGVPTPGTRVRDYLKFLDSALLLKLIEPLEMRARKAGRASKICLVDHALRASWLNERIDILDPAGDDCAMAGHIVESIAGTFLCGLPGATLNHVPGNKDRLEVDFVLSLGDTRIPIEVKYVNRAISGSDLRGLQAFMAQKSNRAPFGLIITRSVARIADPNIVAIPLASLLTAY
jgi:predicted AAA+ superfamily ATPase